MIHRIVIDTNIYISAIFWGGKPRKVVDSGRSANVLIFTSLEIQAEIVRKLRAKFGLSDEETAQILLDFSTFTNLITTHEKISIIDDDPDDNKFIECAVSSRSHFIVTGDKHLLTLNRYKEIRILKATDFLSIISWCDEAVAVFRCSQTLKPKPSNLKSSTRILLLTALKVVRREGIAAVGEATMAEFWGSRKDAKRLADISSRSGPEKDTHPPAVQLCTNIIRKQYDNTPSTPVLIPAAPERQ